MYFFNIFKMFFVKNYWQLCLLWGSDIQWVWKWKSLSRVQHLANPWTIQSMEFSRPEYWSGKTFPFPGGLPNPGIKPRFPVLQADSLSAEPQGKPKNIAVGSLSLFQWVFLTQESNWSLLYCRQILYQLSYQGSPTTVKTRPFEPNPQWLESLEEEGIRTQTHTDGRKSSTSQGERPQMKPPLLTAWSWTVRK